MRCHVKRCRGAAYSAEWLPEFQVILNLCEFHDKMVAAQKDELVLDINRARDEYEQDMSSLRGVV